MATLEMAKIHIEKFWDESFKELEYQNESFNDPESVKYWLDHGYSDRFTGDMCDMRKHQPEWNDKFVDLFSKLGWKDIGTSYYRMSSGTILPTHGDKYRAYIKLFNLENEQHTIHRALVMLEDWKSGHYLEVNGKPIVDWKAGDTFIWRYDDPHLAANMGLEPRYTLQITGHIPNA